MAKNLIFCETTAAYVWHIRELGEGEEANYGGYSGEQPTTLCDSKSSWDLKAKVTARMLEDRGVCTKCREIAKTHM